ncbi:MAG: PEP/pyruvate-binding domain-containing protein [Halioglobus sp.]|nr:PEP/pyruvate-binding domain-containing protein [Halioglobus sp.]
MTNTALVRWFSDLRRTDTAAVGGKNASLGEMIGTLRSHPAFSVPGGFATTADAYWDVPSRPTSWPNPSHDETRRAA